MEKQEHPNINPHHNKSERRITVNYFQPKQSKFFDTFDPNSEELQETGKPKTYRNSPMTNSDFYSQFSIESEQKPTQITPLENESQEIKHTSLRKKQTKYNFISNFKFYLHCGICLTIISGESNLINKISNYL
jgi:hypothetical protein